MQAVITDQPKIPFLGQVLHNQVGPLETAARDFDPEADIKAIHEVSTAEKLLPELKKSLNDFIDKVAGKMSIFDLLMSLGGFLVSGRADWLSCVATAIAEYAENLIVGDKNQAVPKWAEIAIKPLAKAFNIKTDHGNHLRNSNDIKAEGEKVVSAMNLVMSGFTLIITAAKGLMNLFKSSEESPHKTNKFFTQIMPIISWLLMWTSASGKGLGAEALQSVALNNSLKPQELSTLMKETINPKMNSMKEDLLCGSDSLLLAISSVLGQKLPQLDTLLETLGGIFISVKSIANASLGLWGQADKSNGKKYHMGSFQTFIAGMLEPLRQFTSRLCGLKLPSINQYLELIKNPADPRVQAAMLEALA
jgi:hypothetical protein